jgi:plasmid stability protein
MATITIRLDDATKIALEVAAMRSGQTLSDYVRETLGLREQAPRLTAEVERVDENVAALVQSCQAIFKRLDRLEELAGL